MRRKHLVAALVLMAFGVWYGYQTSLLPTRTLPHAPSPSFFPWILTCALLVLAVALLMKGLGEKTPGLLLRAENKAVLASPAIGLLLFGLYVVTLPYLGFLLASLPFFAGCMILTGERRLSWVVVPSIGIPLLLFLIFRHLFRVALPQGLWLG